MTAEETNLLTLKPYYKIRSTATGRLYMDKDLRCYLFESEREALQFCKQFDFLEIEPAELLRQANFVAMCYGMGIEYIRIKTVKNSQFTNIKIEKEDARRQYYNRNAVKNILRLKQTKKRKYLKELKDSVFLVPIVIPERKEKEYPTIQYCFATTPNNETYFLLFTTIHEFSVWNEIQGKKFVPCKITLTEFGRIYKDKSVIINPGTDSLVLTNDQLLFIINEDK